MHRPRKESVAELWKQLLRLVAVDEKCAIALDERVRERAFARCRNAEHKPCLAFLPCRAIAVEIVRNLSAELLPRWRMDLVGRPEFFDIRTGKGLRARDVRLHALGVIVLEAMRINPIHARFRFPCAFLFSPHPIFFCHVNRELCAVCRPSKAWRDLPAVFDVVLRRGDHFLHGERRAVHQIDLVRVSLPLDELAETGKERADLLAAPPIAVQYAQDVLGLRRVCVLREDRLLLQVVFHGLSLCLQPGVPFHGLRDGFGERVGMDAPAAHGFVDAGEDRRGHRKAVRDVFRLVVGALRHAGDERAVMVCLREEGTPCAGDAVGAHAPVPVGVGVALGFGHDAVQYAVHEVAVRRRPQVTAFVRHVA